MVLFSFSIPHHIEKIKNGSKHQTTRIPQKPHKNGSPAYRVGDKVQLYYKSRQKKSCKNCIIFDTSECYRNITGHYPHGIDFCDKHTNFFDKSKIIEIHHYRPGLGMLDLVLGEFWHNSYLGELSDSEKEVWAIADGFQSWQEANHYFKKSTKSDFWAYQPLDVIIWDAEPIIKKWHEMNEATE